MTRRISSRARLTSRIHNELVAGIDRTNQIVTTFRGGAAVGIDCGLAQEYGPESHIPDGNGHWGRPVGQMPIVGMSRFQIAGTPDGATNGGGSPLVRANLYRGTYILTGGATNPWGAGCTVNDFLLAGSGNVNGIAIGCAGIVYGDWGCAVDPSNTNFVTTSNWNYMGYSLNPDGSNGEPYRAFENGGVWASEILSGEGDYWNWPLSKYNDPDMPGGAQIQSAYGGLATINGSALGIGLPFPCQSWPDGTTIHQAKLEVLLTADSLYQTWRWDVPSYAAQQALSRGFFDLGPSTTVTDGTLGVIGTRTYTQRATGFGFSLLGRKPGVWPGTNITKDQWEIIGSGIDGIESVTPGKWATLDATSLLQTMFALRGSEYTDFALMPSIIAGYVGSQDMRGALLSLIGESRSTYEYYSNPSGTGVTMEQRGDEWWISSQSQTLFSTGLPTFGNLAIEFSYPDSEARRKPSYFHTPRGDTPA